MASFRDWRKRIVAILAAFLFLLTSLGFSFLVIYQIHKDNEQNKTNAGLQEALKQAQAKSNKEGKLEGSPLANFTPVAKIDSLQKIDTVAGTGEEVKPGATVTAHYTGAVAATGIVFQSSHDTGDPATFPLSGVIKGWTDGVPGMKVGGTRRLLIPAAEGYGANPPAGSGIPANADLVFDIEMVSAK